MARRTKKKKWKDTSANRKKRWNKKSPMARTGKQNGAWKGGKSAYSNWVKCSGSIPIEDAKSDRYDSRLPITELYAPLFLDLGP